MILLGGIRVIIKEIKIRNLHGEHNYTIRFDSKLTFLYGSNGCGKTTVLNILASIVTGKFYNLIDYLFDKIELEYIDEKGKKEKIEIISQNNGDIRKMEIVFENMNYEIGNIFELKEKLFRKSEDENLYRNFCEMYPFVEKIRETFNYVYLPLSRYGNDIYYDEREYYRYVARKRYYSQRQNSYNNYLNESLQYVADLLKDSCMSINIQENSVNNKFRKEILNSSIRIYSEMPIQKIFEGISNVTWDAVEKLKADYIKILNEIDVYDEKMKEKIEKFFEEFKNAYDDYREKQSSERNEDGIRVDFAWQYAEFLKISDIAELAKKNEKNKEKIRLPKNLFLEVINDFFHSSGTNKKMHITTDGQIYFMLNGRKLMLTDLSSGEKQIIITFASLIFGLKGNETGIFIVDEPEASLHLEWQAKFIPAIMKINKKAQFIFATHSPELIGAYRDKAVKLREE